MDFHFKFAEGELNRYSPTKPIFPVVKSINPNYKGKKPKYSYDIKLPADLPPWPIYLIYTIKSNDTPIGFYTRIWETLQDFAKYHPSILTIEYLRYHYYIIYWKFISPNEVKFSQGCYMNQMYNNPALDNEIRHELYVLHDTLELIANMEIPSSTDGYVGEDDMSFSSEELDNDSVDIIMNELSGMDICEK